MEMLQAGKGAVSTQECSRSLTRPAPAVDSSRVFKLPSVSSLVSSTRTQSGRGVLTLHRCPQGVCILSLTSRTCSVCVCVCAGGLCIIVCFTSDGVLTRHCQPSSPLRQHVVLRCLYCAGDREPFSCFHGNLGSGRLHVPAS